MAPGCRNIIAVPALRQAFSLSQRIKGQHIKIQRPAKDNSTKNFTDNENEKETI